MSIHGADLLPHLIGVLLVAWAAVTEKLGRQAAAYLRNRYSVPPAERPSVRRGIDRGLRENPFLKPLDRSDRWNW